MDRWAPWRARRDLRRLWARGLHPEVEALAARWRWTAADVAALVQLTERTR